MQNYDHPGTTQRGAGKNKKREGQSNLPVEKTYAILDYLDNLKAAMPVPFLFIAI